MKLFLITSLLIGTLTQFTHSTSLARMSSASRPSVFVSRNDIPENGLEILRKSYDVQTYQGNGTIPYNELIKAVVGKDALFVSLNDKVDKDVIVAAGPQLKVVSTMSVGVDHIDRNALKEQGIRLGYTPNVLTEATAELTMALLLATSRRLFEANKEVYTGGWRDWAPLWMTGPGLAGSTVGIVGFGRIGKSVAKKVIAFDAKEILYSANRPDPLEKEYKATFTPLEELLKKSDFVIVNVSLNNKTKGMFNAERFALMKKTAIFINTARGAVVDQDALLNALKTKQILAAGLDVTSPEPLPTDHPLLSLGNCVVLPHIGSATIETRLTMAKLTADNIVAALNNQEMPAEFPLS